MVTACRRAALLSLCVFAVAAATPQPYSRNSFPASATQYLVTLDPTGISGYRVANATEGAALAANASWTTVATIVNNVSYDAVGWDFVQVDASAALLAGDDGGYKAYYGAGFLEGYVTFERIGQVYVGNNMSGACTPPMLAWVEQHLEYMQAQVRWNAAAGYPSAFWTQVGNLLGQMEGIAAGYAAALAANGGAVLPHTPVLNFTDIFLLNFNNELSDVQNVVDEVFRARKAQLRFSSKNLHCSALVKLTANDVYFSHVTWGGYNTMVRQYKVYNFQTTVSMSSVAGTIASGDDWYITSKSLAVQETTNDYYNNTLLQYIVPATVSEFLRVMVANYLGGGGREWVELFQYNNSGTYCNQWMVLDYKLYGAGDLGAQLQDNLLWVAEQIPGNVTSADVTPVLRNTSYWASFNIPYFPNIYAESGFQQLYEEYGDVFSYTKYARPEIFKRNESDVVDLVSMRAIMRYNDWQNDPLSIIPNCSYCNPRGNSWLTISARGDLINDTSFVFPHNLSYAEQFYNGPQGGIDAKISSYSMLQAGMMGNVICGPTYDQQPVFNYDIAYPGQRPPGSANVFDFPWVYFNVLASSNDVPAEVSHTRDVLIGLGIGIPVAIISVVVVVFKYRQDAVRKDEVYTALV